MEKEKKRYEWIYCVYNHVEDIWTLSTGSDPDSPNVESTVYVGGDRAKTIEDAIKVADMHVNQKQLEVVDSFYNPLRDEYIVRINSGWPSGDDVFYNNIGMKIVPDKIQVDSLAAVTVFSTDIEVKKGEFLFCALNDD